jgi:hypothetical protein
MQQPWASPPEVQEQASAYALELWRSLTEDVLRAGLLSEQELELIRPQVVPRFGLAFSRGTLVVMSLGIEALDKLVKSNRRR